MNIILEAADSEKQKILAYEGRIPVSDRELTAAVIDIDNKSI